MCVIVLTFTFAGCEGTKHAATPPSSTSAVPTTPASSTATTSTTTPPRSTTTVAPTETAVLVRHGDTSRRWIALTFDAGADAGNTATILDVLAARRVRASFALTGVWARANPELVRRIASGGHVIMNHTDTHLSFTGFSTHTAPLPAGERVVEISRADAAIAAITGTSTRPWVRPPFGDIDTATAADAARAGHPYVVLWTVDSLGWQGRPTADVAARCLNGAAPGGIMLFHVGSASTDAEALPLVLDGLQGRGYELVTIATSGFIIR